MEQREARQEICTLKKKRGGREGWGGEEGEPRRRNGERSAGTTATVKEEKGEKDLKVWDVVRMEEEEEE